MRVAYLDCFAGIAGDMFLGALIDAGVPEQVLQEATAALGIGASLSVERVDRSGISCMKVHVLDNGELAEGNAHSHSSDRSQNGAFLEQAHDHVPLSMQPETQHLHKTGHPHTHPHVFEDERHASDEAAHEHVHGRSLTEIRRLIQEAPLYDAVKVTAITAFEFLGRSEAKIHNVAVDEIHFHEVGAVDAIVDIVASAAGIHHLEIGAWYSSPLNVGGGMVVCAHGRFPVPAPATADLLRGIPTYSAHIQKELVTPTGAALIRSLNPAFGPQPAMAIDQIGYGAGTRNPKDFPNVLRLSIGELSGSSDVDSNTSALTAQGEDVGTDLVTVLETAVDDASPQLIAYVAEQALAKGALDIMLTPVIMKKGRPGTLVTLLCTPSTSTQFEDLLLRETPTLGIRKRNEQRTCLHREHVSVETPYGPVRMKVGSAFGEQRNAAPEFEDCKAAAAKSNVALKQVQQAAIAAFHNQAERS